MNSMMDVGADIHLYSDHSWAVVCIKGHPEYVSFMPLSSDDARSVIRFLQRFKYSNKVVDSPFGFHKEQFDAIDNRANLVMITCIEDGRVIPFNRADSENDKIDRLNRNSGE